MGSVQGTRGSWGSAPRPWTPDCIHHHQKPFPLKDCGGGRQGRRKTGLDRSHKLRPQADNMDSDPGSAHYSPEALPDFSTVHFSVLTSWR